MAATDLASLSLGLSADPTIVRAMHVLKGVNALNKDQGLGFAAGGQVITKRTAKPR